MLKKLVQSLIVGLGFFFFPFFAFGNDGSYTKIESSQTGAAMPIQNDSIWMVEEDIKIVFSRIGYDSQWMGDGMTPPHVTGGRVITKCNFTFRNMGSQQQEVLLGYPVTQPLQIIDFGNRGYQIKNVQVKPDLGYFEVRLNGKEIPFDFATHETNPSLTQVGPYQGVYLFKAVFEPNETIKISNTVIQDYKWWPGRPEHKYILTTGATWKKPIGRSRITISFPDIVKEILFLSHSPMHRFLPLVPYLNMNSPILLPRKTCISNSTFGFRISVDWERLYGAIIQKKISNQYGESIC